MEEAAQDETDFKSDDGNLPKKIMVRRDVLNNRIVVSLWTVQVVTVLFTVVSLSIWMILGTSVALQDTGTAVLGICCLAILVAALIIELRLYVLHVLSIGIYARLQVAKVGCWTLVLLMLLWCSIEVEGAGARVLMEAGKKLILPFLASVLHSIIVYSQERASRARNDVDPIDQLFLASERLRMASPG